MGIRDASKGGFADSFLSFEGIRYSYGTWNSEVFEKSSNFREFRNFLDSVRQEGEQGISKNSLMFSHTDNGLVESAIYQGPSDCSHLLDMVIEFSVMQIEFTFTCSVVHVAGTQMIEQGVDGLSRGSTNKVEMIGRDFLFFSPLH